MSPSKDPRSFPPGAAGRALARIADRLLPRTLISAGRRDAATAGAAACAFAAGLVLIVALGPGAASSSRPLGLLDAGTIADRDIVAEREIRYEDEKATALRIEAEERLVLPIFALDDAAAGRAIERFSQYRDLMASLVERKLAGDTLFLSVQSDFPGLVAKEEVLALARSPLRAQALSQADSILRRLLERGIAAPPAAGLERFNPDYVELRRLKDGRPETEEIPAGRLVTLKNLLLTVDEETTARRLAKPLAALTSGLVRSFAAEDVFFDADQSEKKLESVRDRVEPVVRVIAKGERIVRKGAIVTAADSLKLAEALGAAGRIDWGLCLGSLGLFAAAFLTGLYVLGRGVSGLGLKRPAALLALSFAFLYFLTALVLERLAKPATLDLAFLLPTALLTMLAAIMTNTRVAVLSSLVLALLAQAAAGTDGRLLAFVLLSGTAGAFAVRSAQSRIDLVKAGAVLAFLMGAAAAVLAFPGAGRPAEVLLAAVFGAASGFACALLALAFLPILEQALNAPTRFRLMELSDLNAPILKRLLTVAPGTYSHSITVAHLAESAAREIGADSLLARVGAYYHDIGKIEQPEYFAENQSGYNKHVEINPRLSATVIRSHVKLGAEKARALGLPEDVVDIVAQHHGNAVIAWFYDQARKADAEAEADDFSYPGQPPTTREAAIVMLADSVEASTRTLKKPTMTRLEDFIKDIVMDKVKQGQLDRCELTFKDIEAIRTSFTRILAGHFHSRIEYPKKREQAR